MGTSVIPNKLRFAQDDRTGGRKCVSLHQKKKR